MMKVLVFVMLLIPAFVWSQQGEPYQQDYLRNQGTPYQNSQQGYSRQSPDYNQRTENNPNPKILDFEADVIQGQKKRPDIFIQGAVENLSLDEILYLRKDFNDFHVVDGDAHPRYYEPRRRRNR